jgi:hypothetical protein
VTGLLVALAVVVVVSESVMLGSQEKRKKATKEKVERCTKDGYTKERRKKAKKHFREEIGCFGKSQQKLSLPQLPIFPRSCVSAPSDPLSFPVAWATVALGPTSGPELGWE